MCRNTSATAVGASFRYAYDMIPFSSERPASAFRVGVSTRSLSLGVAEDGSHRLCHPHLVRVPIYFFIANRGLPSSPLWGYAETGTPPGYHIPPAQARVLIFGGFCRLPDPIGYEIIYGIVGSRPSCCSSRRRSGACFCMNCTQFCLSSSLSGMPCRRAQAVARPPSLSCD